MKKLILCTAIAAAISVSTSASATALTGSETLNFDAGVTTSNAYGSVFFVKSGSYFGMDTNTKSAGIKASERTAISQSGGFILGSTPAASGSHVGAPGCVSDSGTAAGTAMDPVTCTNGDSGPVVANIDNPWNFFGNTGMHGATSALNFTDGGASSGTVDMSGWFVTWAGIPVINMGSGGTATIACTSGTNTCADGESYTLDYDAVVPVGDPSGFGGVSYTLHLEGTVSAVPVPAAVWLFGSGLLGLVGVARRKATV